jgi:hypothetical protein
MPNRLHANLRFEAMRGLFNGSKKLFVVADGSQTDNAGSEPLVKMGVSVP